MDGFGDEINMWAQGTARKEEEEQQQEKDSSTKLIFLNAVVDKELYTYIVSYSHIHCSLFARPQSRRCAHHASSDHASCMHLVCLHYSSLITNNHIQVASYDTST